MEAAYTIPALPAELFSHAPEAFDGMIHHLESRAALAMTHAELEAYVVGVRDVARQAEDAAVHRREGALTHSG